MSVEKLQRIGHKCYVKKIPFIPGICTILMRVLHSADFPVQLEVGRGVRLGHGGIGIVINSRSKIGKNVVIAQNVTLAAKKGAPEIGDWTYIGANSVILGGVKIGKNVIVGALSLVNIDVPDNAVVAGIPAKIIRYRTEEEIQKHQDFWLRHGCVKE